MPNFDIPKKPKEETVEEIIEGVRKLSEKVGGVPQIEVDLFGGKTSDEMDPKKIDKKGIEIARAQRNSGLKNIRRRGNIRLERMLPSGDQ